MAIMRMYKGAPDNEHFYCIPRIQKDNDTRIQLEEKCIGMAGFESLSTVGKENFQESIRKMNLRLSSS